MQQHINENDKTIKDGRKTASKFDKHFANIILKLNLKKDTEASFVYLKKALERSNRNSVTKNLPAGKASVSNYFKATISTLPHDFF